MPALGSPTSPTSASSLSRRSSQPSSPASPRSAKRGAWWVEPREALVAAPAAAAVGDDDAPAGRREVVHRAVLGRDLRPRRDADDEVLALGAVAQGALAVAPALGAEVRAALEGLQVAQRVVAEQDDVAAVAAVAAVGPAARHVGLAAEGQAAVPAAAGLHEDASLVVEHDLDPLEQRTRMADDDGKVFLITGASTGIGAETARQAAEAGYRLVLAARSRDRLEALSDELGGAERALAVACDVMDWGEQERLAAAALDAFGRIDVVFANAGFGAKRGFLEETPEHWRDMVLTNVLGVAYTIRATLPAVKDARGHFLLTSSVAGRRALPGLAVLGHEARRHRDGRGPAPGRQRHAACGSR